MAFSICTFFSTYVPHLSLRRNKNHGLWHNVRSSGWKWWIMRERRQWQVGMEDGCRAGRDLDDDGMDVLMVVWCGRGRGSGQAGHLRRRAVIRISWDQFQKALLVSWLNRKVDHHLKQYLIFMKIITRCYYSTLRSQLQRLQTSYSNVPANIIQLLDRRLLHIPNHPLTIIKEAIKASLTGKYHPFDDLSPIVTPSSNFEVLNISPEHVSRQKSDTYYISESQLLRTHTSAHQLDLLKRGLDQFVVFGDVYRRDEIDRYHYPVFHQMEAVSILGSRDTVSEAEAVDDLKQTLEQISDDLFGKCDKRWIKAYFPFTHPSFELQIFYDNKWVEMLGCGVIHEKVLERSGRAHQRGWAAGLGLERFAMKLFKIPDVRLFWSQDPRFLNQFSEGRITEFAEFSKYPVCYKDLSMWITPAYNPNDLFELIRGIGGDLIETVEETMTYDDEKNGRTAKGYRISFRSLERTLGNPEITKYQMRIREEIKSSLATVELR